MADIIDELKQFEDNLSTDNSKSFEEMLDDLEKLIEHTETEILTKFEKL